MTSMLPPTRLKADLRRASHLGRNGDTLLAHLSPAEAQLLELLGGVGTKNPSTGLPQFYVNSGGANGSMQGGVGGNSTAGSHGGSAGGKGSGSGGGAPAAPSAHQVAISQASTGALPSTGTTSYGAPIHTSTGPTYGGISVARTPESWTGLKDEVNTYNDAAGKWNARTPVDRFLNFMAPLGLTSIAPDLSRPASFTGGDFHIGINPASAVAGVAGGLLGPGVGLALGPDAGALYDAAGFHDPILTGPDVPHDWPTLGGSSPRPASGPGPAVAHGPSNGRTGGASLLPQILGDPGAATAPGLPPTSGSALPPTAAPAFNTSAGGYRSIPGPSSYGFQLPAWLYR